MRRSIAFIAAGLLLSAFACSSINAQGKSGPCDRACLEGFVDKYLDAAIAHDPSLLPLSKDVKFTENGQRLVSPTGTGKS